MPKKNFTFKLDEKLIDTLRTMTTDRINLTDYVDMALKDLISKYYFEDADFNSIVSSYFTGSSDRIFEKSSDALLKKKNKA